MRTTADLQHVLTSVNRDSQDAREERVERIDSPEGWPMHGPYPGELRMRVIDFVEGGGSRLRRSNSRGQHQRHRGRDQGRFIAKDI